MTDSSRTPKHHRGPLPNLSAARACGHLVSVAWWCGSHQRIDQLSSHNRYVIDSAVKHRRVGLGRLCEAAQLAHELNRRRVDLGIGRGR